MNYSNNTVVAPQHMRLPLIKLSLVIAASLFNMNIVGAAIADEGDGRSADIVVNSTNVLIGQVAGYSAANANEEGYWYSRYALGSLARQSGLGVALTPAQMQMIVPGLMAAVGAASDDPIVVPKNVAVLVQVYAGGDPHFKTPITDTTFLADAGDARWVGGPPVQTTASTAFMAVKMLEWAKMFHRDKHFGQANVDHFGAFWRFQGMVFQAETKMMLSTLLANRAAYQESAQGDYALLMAFSDAAGLYSAPDEANNQGPNALPPSYPPENRYLDPAASAQFLAAAKSQFHKVLGRQPESAREIGLAIQATVWYASVTSDPTELSMAGAAVKRWANHLADRVHHTFGEGYDDDGGPAARAYEVRGLIEAGRTTGDATYLRAAADAFSQMTANFDATHGVLAGTRRLTTGDVGEIAAAFNAAGVFLGSYIGTNAASAMFGQWWEATLDLSGMEISSPGYTDFKSHFELFDPPGRSTTLQNPLNYRYPAVPLPQNAGGPNGEAFALASWIQWNPEVQSWYANHGWVDVADEMHTASEFMWFHSDEVNGFPVMTFR